MSDCRFEKSLEISAFRGLAVQLLENKLITKAEFRKIINDLETKRNALIGESRHQTPICRKIERCQVENGLDSFVEQSDD